MSRLIQFKNVTFAKQHVVMFRVSQREVKSGSPKTPCIELSLTSRTWYFDFDHVEQAEQAEAELITKLEE